MKEPFKVGIAGLGTVGAGVVKIIQQNADLIAARAGRPVEIVAVSARDRKRERGVDVSGYQWIDDPAAMAVMPGLDAVVELIGGAEGAAHDVVTGALEIGRHVVTANKALLAHHGHALAVISDQNGAQLRFEASVAGCIPVIKALREGFAANRITALYGILNGTCNYILTRMRETGRPFADILQEAQDKGYAEADPAFDIEGTDAAHKLAVLSAIAFGMKPDIAGVETRGIAGLTDADIRFAGEMGYRIKLLASAKMHHQKISQIVEPCLVPIASPLGAIEDVYNAVIIEGENIETPLLSGRGAGQGPTASAVVGDIIDLARGARVPVFGVAAGHLVDMPRADRGDVSARYYMRLNVLDVPGVIADVGAIMRDHAISIESFIQHGRDPRQPVSVVLITHHCRHSDVMAACGDIADLKVTLDRPHPMRIEDL